MGLPLGKKRKYEIFQRDIQNKRWNRFLEKCVRDHHFSTFQELNYFEKMEFKNLIKKAWGIEVSMEEAAWAWRTIFKELERKKKLEEKRKKLAEKIEDDLKNRKFDASLIAFVRSHRGSWEKRGKKTKKDFKALLSRRYGFNVSNKYAAKVWNAIYDTIRGEKTGITRPLKKLGDIVIIEGIPLLNGKSILLKLYSNKLSIVDISEKTSYKIDIDNITNVKIKTEIQITERERNVLARAIAGGILFGEIGAIVGALSGIPKKQIVREYNFLIIDYFSKNGEKKSLTFLYISEKKEILEKFVEILTRRIKKSSPKNEIEL